MTKRQFAFITINIILITTLSLLSGLLYFENTKTYLTNVNVDKEIKDNSISKVEAEKKNLDKIHKLPKDYTDLTQATWFSKKMPAEINMILSPILYKFDGDKVIADEEVKKLIKNNASTIPVFYVADVKKNSLNNNLTTDLHAKEIAKIADDNNYSAIEIDSSYLTQSNYHFLLETLNIELQKISVDLIVSLPARWGDYVDYTNYRNFDSSYYKDIDYTKINTYADEIRIKAYNYTTPNNALAGPISPIGWVESVIKYHIHKGVDRQKIVLGVNTLSYEWSSREYVTDNSQNYIWIEKEVSNIYSEDEYQNYIIDKTFEKIESNYEEVFTLESSIIVHPDENYINNVELLASAYGLKGFILLVK